MNIHTLTNEEFNNLPLVTEGESKEVRYAGNGQVVIRLKPTIYSYTHNRAGVIAGSDALRLQSIKKLLPVLRDAGVSHTYLEVNDRWILSRLVLQPHLESRPKSFRPDDMNVEELAKLPVASPLEVVVKHRHSGTPKHRYYEFDRYPTLHSHETTHENDIYPHTVVRFDWRNPMVDHRGTRLADEVLPEDMARWFINVDAAKETAHTAFNALQDHMKQRELELWDICFFIATDGTTMFGEVSPDCVRVRAADGATLDKDVWRHGGSSEDVLQKWQAFTDTVGES